MIRKISNIVTIINVMFESVLLLLCLLELRGIIEVMKVFGYLFFVYRISFLLAAVFLVLIIISIIKKNFRISDAVMLGLNIQYIVFWLWFVSI